MMNDNLNPNKEHLSEADKQIEKALRPQYLEDFSGQGKIVDNLKIFILINFKIGTFNLFPSAA